MLKKLISPEAMRVMRKTNGAEIHDRSITGVHDIVGIGTGSNAKLCVSTYNSNLDHNSYVIMIDLLNVSDPICIPELIEESSSEITSLASSSTTLYCCEDDRYGDEDKDILSITLSKPCQYSSRRHKKIYINDLSASWSGITVFKDNLYASDRNRGRIHTSEHDEGDQLSRILEQGGTQKTNWEWIGVAVCGDKLYAAATNMDLCVYNESHHVFEYHDNIKEQSFFGSYKKLKGINNRLYFIDTLWHLWEYDPTNPTSLKQICKELRGISSICQVNDKFYVSQIDGGIYEYIPDDLTK